MSRSSAAYDEDFYAWTQDQAREIRRAGAERNNAPIDWENVAEEIECMGRSQRSEIWSRLIVLEIHLLKWLYCPELRDRCSRGWRLTVLEQRDELSKELTGSPSLRPHAQEVFGETYQKARRRAAVEAEVEPARFPADPAFTLDQALDPAYPADLFPPEWRA
ncbi:DUF29 domain-containing protein [Azospirillum sp. TSO22-1]|uniref:DUF29 domain-containing protein n=1 Tax=Azospirillum sp. TSO22-1 TaxID=716789 RepID=UPI000D61F31D|nr:DUF29 domain-containing protein [Azospirillum sp. TSO22-1]PWC55620.1 hypothetical protein TSO221_04960 [Azospirillum sp. TSO22-1]